MSESLFFVVPIIEESLLEATVTARLARQTIPDCRIVGLSGVDLDVHTATFDLLLAASDFVAPFEPRAMAPGDLMALAAPQVLKSLLAEQDAGVWCGSGIVPRSCDIAFGSSPVTLGSLATIPQRESLTPTLPASLDERSVLPDPRLILITSEAGSFLEAWAAVGHDAVVDLRQALVREHMNTFVVRAAGRPDVTVDSSSILMAWVDYLAVAPESSTSKGPPSFLDSTPLFAAAMSRLDEDADGPVAVEWEMLFNRVRNAEPVQFIRDEIDRTVPSVTSVPASALMEFVWSVRRSLDPFGYKWGGKDSAAAFLDWLRGENQFGFSRASDLLVRGTPFGSEFQGARYSPKKFHAYLDHGGVAEIGFDPRTMVEAPKLSGEEQPSGKFEPFRWRWNIVKQLIPGYKKRESSARLKTRTAAEPKRVPVHREPSLWGSSPRTLSLIGGLRSESGLGQAARMSSRALNMLGRSYSHVDVSAALASRNSADPGLDWDTYGNFGDVNLVHSNADEMITWAPGPYRNRFGGRFNAVMWFWETTELPPRPQESFDIVDELWVASEYLVDVFGQYGRVPVYNIGMASELPEFRQVDRSRFNIGQDEFVFLFVYDALSSDGRKNPEKALRAFVNAFGPTFRDVRFILKVSNLAKFPASQERLLRMQAENPAINIMDGYLAHEDVLDLMAAADVYVSLHSAEGYGLTLLESMALGTPVICTGYSGNMDFTTEANSWLVDYEMTRIMKQTGPYPAGGSWASPDVESATELMRRAEANRQDVVAKAALARADANEAASLNEYARRLDAQLRRIGV